MDVIQALFWLVWQTGKLVFHLGWLILRLSAKAARWRLKAATVTHGSARFAKWHEVVFSGIWGGPGLVLGKKYGRFLRFNDEGYALIFGPRAAGKACLSWFRRCSNTPAP